MKLQMTGYRFDRDLQIIQADVRLELDGRIVIDEPLCVDVGMPALAASLHDDAVPDRLAPPEQWRTKPFFICGCGDPECRAYSFRVRHDPARETVLLQEVEERGEGVFRVLEEWELPAAEYREQVLRTAVELLRFADGLDGYRPLYPETMAAIRAEIERCRP